MFIVSTTLFILVYFLNLKFSETFKFITIFFYTLLSVTTFYINQEHWLKIISKKRYFKHIKNLIRILFILSLCILSIISFLNVSIYKTQETFFSQLNLILVITSIISGILTFWFNHTRLLNTSILKKSDLSIKKELTFFFIIFAIGLLLRFWNVANLGIWVEEQFSAISGYNLVQQGLPLFENNLYVRAYLYTLLNAGIFKFFGFGIFQIRLISTLISLGTLTLIYIVLRRALPKTYALWGTLIYALSDFAILYARYDRFYIMLAFLYLLFLFSIYKLYFLDNKKYLYITILITLLLPGFDVNSIIYLPVVSGSLLLLKSKIIKNYTFWLFNTTGIIGFVFFKHVENLSIALSPKASASSSSVGLLDTFHLYLESFHITQIDLYFINFLVQFFPIFVISILCTSIFILTRPRNISVYFSILLVLFIVFNLAFLSFYSVNREYYHWDQRHISFLIPILICNFIFFLFYLRRLFLNKYTYFIAMLLILLPITNPIELNRVINMNYGDDLRNTRHLVMGAETYRSDYTTPYEFVDSNYKEGDIIISDNFLSLPNYKTPNYKLSIDDNVDRVKQIINLNKRVWIIDVTYDMKKFHAPYRWAKIYTFLESNKSSIIYYGKDNRSRVYLFQQDTSYNQ